MNDYTLIPNNTIAGISPDVFSTLPADDKAFLTLLDRMGMTLEAAFQKIPK